MCIIYCIGPDTPPDQFTSTPNVFDVLFMWGKPRMPKGIIVSYTINITHINTVVTTTNIAKGLSLNLAGFEPYQNYTATITAATVVGDGPPAVISGRTDPHSKRERERERERVKERLRMKERAFIIINDLLLSSINSCD